MDVRDVALAHSLALLDPRAKGRYILVSDCLNFLQMVHARPLQWPLGRGCMEVKHWWSCSRAWVELQPSIKDRKCGKKGCGLGA